MRAYRISIAIHVNNEGEYGKDQTQIYQAYWRSLYEVRETAKDYAVERLRNILDWYEAYCADKEREIIKHWPPHSLLCECKHRCKAKPRKYWTFLKNEIKWGPDGHILDDKEEQEWLRIRKTMKQMLSVLVVAKVIPITTATQVNPKQ